MTFENAPTNTLYKHTATAEVRNLKNDTPKGLGMYFWVGEMERIKKIKSLISQFEKLGTLS